MPSLCHGSVVWVTILDPQGRNPKRRPAVVLTTTDEITPDGAVLVVGVSTTYDHSAPETQTELQFDPRGNCRSGLRERCWAVSTWLVQVPVSAIEEQAGTIPGRQLIEIKLKMEATPTEE